VTSTTRHPSGRRHLTCAARVLTGVLALAACGAGDDGGAGGLGEPLPTVEVTPLDGSDPISLDEITGPAVVNLWATWCVPCRTEMPEFEAVHRARAGEVRFVGVNIGDDAPQATEFVDEVGVTFEQYLDPDGSVQTGLAATQLPVTVVIDAGGAITTKVVGRMDQTALEVAIDEAVGG
jgi:thiol-disulfide isomerase/thioredoxin